MIDISPSWCLDISVYYLNKLISAPSVLFGKVDLVTHVTFFFFCVVFPQQGATCKGRCEDDD
jgi:hypothetical protein